MFVLAADRSVAAYDGQTGRRLWNQTRPGEPLVLRQSGVMLAVGDTLVVGLGGRMVGINPANGTPRWEAPIATPRGTNDVERLVDLVGTVSRVGNAVAPARTRAASAASMQHAAASSRPSRPSGAEGLHGDDRLLFGTESDGKVQAWRRDDGERAWARTASSIAA